MPRESFRDDLDQLQAGVVSMGQRVLAQLDDALTALATGNAELATDVIDGDAAINERYLDLEARCVDLFALQQPVASDLRFVAAAFKILTDLERVGDLATNLGQYTLAAGDADQPLLAPPYSTDADPADSEGTADAVGADAAGSDAADSAPLDVAPTSVIEIGRDAQAMLADALEAFEAGEADACLAIAERDDDLDVLCQHAGEDVVRGLLENGVASAAPEAGGAAVGLAAAGETSGDADVSEGIDPQATSWDVEAALDDVSRVLLTIRDLERVGDHAVNVAARTYYMVEHDPMLIV